MRVNVKLPGALSGAKEKLTARLPGVREKLGAWLPGRGGGKGPRKPWSRKRIAAAALAGVLVIAACVGGYRLFFAGRSGSPSPAPPLTAP